MQKWEYRTVYITTKLGFGKADLVMRDTGLEAKDYKLASELAGTAWIGSLTEHLNRLGQNGWELVSSHTMPPGGGGKLAAEHYYVMKRAVPTTADQ